MNLLPEYFDIQSFRISTAAIFFGLSFFTALFVYWHETRRDGFEEERAFDLFIFLSIFSLIFSRIVDGLLSNIPVSALVFHVIYFWRDGYSIWGAIIGSMIPLFFLTKKWKWSIFRISDTLSLSLSIGLAVYLLGSAVTYNYPKYIVLSFVFFTLYIILSKIRLKYKSGLATSVFLAINAVIWPAYNLEYLPFSAVLITISVVNLYYREKKNPMNSKLPANFIKNIKNILKKKEAEIETEQTQLLSEDPYLAEGRDSVDEYLDDAKEDEFKAVNDLRLASLATIKRQVRKALGKINIGSYGICEVCGEPINKERLIAYPEATTCVKHGE